MSTKFTVRIVGSADRRQEFEDWMTGDHFVKMLALPEVADATLYRRVMGEEKYEYVTVYTFPDTAAVERFMASDTLAGLAAEFDELWGEASERKRYAYERVWP